MIRTTTTPQHALSFIHIIILSLLSLTSSQTWAQHTFDTKTPLDKVRESAQAGHPDAQYQLALRLLAGKGHSPQVERLLNDAMEDIRNANRPNAVKEKEVEQLNTSIKENETKEAIELLESAASKKHAASMVKLGLFYKTGENIPKNIERSLDLIRQAADLGSSDAMVQLGFMYAEGVGVTEDLQEAVKCFEKSYAQGYAAGGILLAEILIDGGYNGKDTGYPKNPQRAYVLARAAQLVNDPDSRIFAWGGRDVAKARQQLGADQLLDAETAAEKEAERLKATSTKTVASNPTVDLKTPGSITKQEWKDALGKAIPGFSATGEITLSKNDFLKLCGEPHKTQTVGETTYWYYQCKNGMIQLALNKTMLLTGTLRGKANDY